MAVKQLIDLGITLFGLVSARAFALFSSIIIARISGASTFGEYSLFVTIFVIASEVPNAIDTTFIRFSNSKLHNHPVALYQSIAIIIKLGYALTISLFGWFLAPVISEYAFNKPDSAGLVYWSLVAAAFMCVHTLLVGSYQQRKQFTHVALIRPIAGLGVFLVLGYFALNNHEINIINISQIYLYVTAPLALMSLGILIPKVKSYFTESVHHIRVFLKVALLLVVSSVITLVSNRMDIFFLTSHLDFNSVGQYGAAIRVSVIVALITAAMTTIYVPKASAATQVREAFNKYIQMMLTYSAIQTMLALLIIWQIDFIVDVIFGDDYKGIELIATILIVQVLFEAYSRGFQALIQCGPHPKYIVVSSVLRLILSVVLLALLIPSYGATGGAIAVAATSGVIGLILMYFALRDCKPAKGVENA